jgi:hypothetical protein
MWGTRRPPSPKPLTSLYRPARDADYRTITKRWPPNSRRAYGHTTRRHPTSSDNPLTLFDDFSARSIQLPVRRSSLFSQTRESTRRSTRPGTQGSRTSPEMRVGGARYTDLAHWSGSPQTQDSAQRGVSTGRQRSTNGDSRFSVTSRATADGNRLVTPTARISGRNAPQWTDCYEVRGLRGQTSLRGWRRRQRNVDP